MDVTYQVVIVGAGRLGRSVSALLALKNIPHQIIKKGDDVPEADIYYLCVPDSEIDHVVRLIPKVGVCLHAAGSIGPEVLSAHPCHGVLHPIMSFPGPEFEIPTGKIPATYSGMPEAMQKAFWLGAQLGFTVYELSGDRTLYHAAAVIAGNYASVLLRMAGTLLSECGVTEPHQALLPLAQMSLRSAAQHPLSVSLTGPIARGDTETINLHQDALEKKFPHIKNAYNALLLATNTQLKIEE
ncbi:MAG: DUF2520 domain-containing protein [Myxococcota bacterium]